MSYTIDERNPERKQLLAELLNPGTRQVLARLPAIPASRVLDLGCGQGNTTRLLAEALAPAECVGVDYDPTPCSALDSINKIWQGLFQNPSGGRRLVRYFRGAGAAGIDAGAIVQLEHDSTTIKRIYRLTAEATGPLAESRGVLTAGEVEDMIAGLTRLEEDASNVLMKCPDMWVIATREAARA